jgi:hypothetical protein
MFLNRILLEIKIIKIIPRKNSTEYWYNKNKLIAIKIAIKKVAIQS